MILGGGIAKTYHPCIIRPEADQFEELPKGIPYSRDPISFGYAFGRGSVNGSIGREELSWSKDCLGKSKLTRYKLRRINLSTWQ